MCTEKEKRDDETFECVVELVPVVVTIATDPLKGAAKLLTWLVRCLPRLGSHPELDKHRRRRVLRAARDFGDIDWVILTPGRTSQ
jgi:hypothetical protein